MNMSQQALQQVKHAYLPNATAPEHVEHSVNVELKQLVETFNNSQQRWLNGNCEDTNIFAHPKKHDIIRLETKTKEFLQSNDWLSLEQASDKINQWKNHAKAQYESPAIRSNNSDKIVLSLFDKSGQWSQPWVDAGYEVHRFDIQDDHVIGDVNSFSIEFFEQWFEQFNGKQIYAILAACPCTDFAVSGARHFAGKDLDGRTVASIRLVHQTIRTIEYFKPAIWALENPVGRIEKLGGLPKWRLSFNPNHLGEAYTKKTLIWGLFNADLPIAPVFPSEGSKMHSKYGGKSMATKNARSVTPEGFAYAFFMANNANDNAAMSLINTFNRLDSQLIAQAISVGVEEQDLISAIEDYYYIDLDDDAANEAIRTMIEFREQNR